MTTTRYQVPGMSCDHCKQRIEAAVSTVSGVEGIGVDLDAKIVTVSGGDPTTIAAAITGAGYAIA